MAPPSRFARRLRNLCFLIIRCSLHKLAFNAPAIALAYSFTSLGYTQATPSLIVGGCYGKQAMALRLIARQLPRPPNPQQPYASLVSASGDLDPLAPNRTPSCFQQGSGGGFAPAIPPPSQAAAVNG